MDFLEQAAQSLDAIPECPERLALQELTMFLGMRRR
jgi:hypothetical protein